MLQRLHSATQDELLQTVEDLLGAAQFLVEQRAVVQAAALRMRSRAGVKVRCAGMTLLR